MRNKSILKICWCATLFVGTMLPVKAQWSVGVLAGADYNDYTFRKGYAENYYYGGKRGFELTVPVQYQVKEWLGVRADLSYVQKGHHTRRTEPYAGEWSNTRDHYLQLPLMASFSVGGPKVRAWANPGVYAGYWLESHWTGVSQPVTDENNSITLVEDNPSLGYHFNEKIPFNSQRDNRWDAGLTGVVGVGWRFLPAVEARLEGVCWYSLVDRASGSAHNLAPRYDTTYAVRAGFVYYFNPKKKSEK